MSLLSGVRLLVALVSLTAPAAANEIIPGPVPAEVVSVYDGDTLTVIAHPWPSLAIETGVRVLGIDTPEIRGKCPEEKAAAIAARDALIEIVGETVKLYQVQEGKYAGRVVAVVVAGGRDVVEQMLERGHGRRYDGGRREAWCPGE